MPKEWAGRVGLWATLLASVLMFGEMRMAFALNPGSGPISLPNPLSANSLQQVVASVTNFLLVIAIPLVAIMAIVGGFQMITAGGEPERFANGRKTLTYAVIGFAVVLLAGGIAQIIKDLLGSQ